MLAVVVELAELFQFVLFWLFREIGTVRDNMNVIVSRLVQHKLSLRYYSVGAFEVVQNLHLMLIDGLHELIRPEPDIVVFVH